jgi:hypothetical protein
MCEPNADEQINAVIRAACAAPSIHNSQPWEFSADGELLKLHGSVDRAMWVSDPAARALYISCGAALFNACLAIRMAGAEPKVRLLPHPEHQFDVLAVIQAEPGRPPTASESELYGCIWRRRTNRGPYTDRPIPLAVQARLAEAAQREHAALHLLNRAEATAVLEIAAEAGKELARDAGHQAELRRWIATGRDEGIPAGALPARPASAPWPVRVDDFLAAGPDARQTSATYERFPQLAVLTTEHDEPENWLVAGQALQRVLLTATASGLSASFLYHPIELRDMHGEAPSAWPGQNPQMIVRLGYAAVPAVPVPRRLSVTPSGWEGYRAFGHTGCGRMAGHQAS